jgi:hypothetical protein
MRGQVKCLGGLVNALATAEIVGHHLNILTPPKWLPTCAVGRQGWRQRNPWTRASEHP